MSRKSKFALRSAYIFNTRYFRSKMAVPHALPTMTPLHLPKTTQKRNCTYVEITRLYNYDYSDHTLNSFIDYICTLFSEIVISLLLTKFSLAQLKHQSGNSQRMRNDEWTWKVSAVQCMYVTVRWKKAKWICSPLLNVKSFNVIDWYT